MNLASHKILGNALVGIFQRVGDQPMQSEHYPIHRQECQSQRIRDQVEMDTQIGHRLQAEEQANEQYQFSQTVRKMVIDSVNQSPQASHR